MTTSSSKIRIAITQPDVRPYRTPVYKLLAAQPGIELTLLAGHVPDAPDLDTSNINFHFIHAPVVDRRRGPITLKYQPAQREVIDPSRFDLVIQSWNAHYSTLWPALGKASRIGLPLVLWGHGYSKRDSALRTAIRNLMGRRATAIMLYTHEVAERMITKYGFPRNRVFVAQNAIDQAPIAAARNAWLATPDRLKEFQQTHRLVPQQTIAFVSRLYRENRPDMLVEAIAWLQARFPNVAAVIVGDGPERENLRQLAMDRGIAERVHLVGTIYDEHQLAPWLLSSRAFCYPENIGLSLLTAFGFGLPAVTSDNLAGQNPEIVALTPGQNGLLYRVGSLEAMVESLSQLLEDDTLHAAMSQAALDTVEHKFTLANMVQGFLDTTRLVDGVERRVVV